MIDIKEKIKDEPYDFFYKLYQEAQDSEQFPLNAIAISTFDSSNNEVDSRFVNLKYVIKDE